MTDEFMFGRSILACPIVNPQYTEEKIVRTDAMTGWDRQEGNSEKGIVNSVDFTATKSATKYLPGKQMVNGKSVNCSWYDFWTNKQYKGGQDITIETSLDRVPMFVRAGSILPLGPEMQYVGEKAWDNLELRIYPGADGQFTLYEDEGDGYNYEKGVYSTITFQWSDKSRTLTIGKRQGEFPGMLKTRKFTVVMPDGSQQTVEYNGEEIKVKNFRK